MALVQADGFRSWTCPVAPTMSQTFACLSFLIWDDLIPASRRERQYSAQHLPGAQKMAVLHHR
jgi:hypothetical protein